MFDHHKAEFKTEMKKEPSYPPPTTSRKPIFFPPPLSNIRGPPMAAIPKDSYTITQTPRHATIDEIINSGEANMTSEQPRFVDDRPLPAYMDRLKSDYEDSDNEERRQRRNVHNITRYRKLKDEQKAFEAMKEVSEKKKKKRLLYEHQLAEVLKSSHKNPKDEKRQSKKPDRL